MMLQQLADTAAIPGQQGSQLSSSFLNPAVGLSTTANEEPFALLSYCRFSAKRGSCMLVMSLATVSNQGFDPDAVQTLKSIIGGIGTPYHTELGQIQDTQVNGLRG